MENDANPIEKGITFYEYLDVSGTPVYRKAKKVRTNGKKDFWIERLMFGAWVSGRGDCELMPYNLPDSTKYTKAIVCEGEKDADNVKRVMRESFDVYWVTSAPFGKGSWPANMIEHFRPMEEITFLYDVGAEEDAMNHAMVLRNALPETKIYVAHVPLEKEGSDITDYINNCAEHAGDFIESEILGPSEGPLTQDVKPVANKTVGDGVFYSTQIERLVLGLSFFDNSIIRQLEADMFYWEKNVAILELLQRLVEKNGEFDLASVQDATKVHPSLSQSDITPLLEGVPSSDVKSSGAHIKRLKEYRMNRGVDTTASKLRQHLASANPERIGECIDEMRKHTVEGSSNNQVYDIDGLIEGYDEFSEQGGGISIGIPTFDGMSRGMAPGEVMYFLARAKVIKSILVQNILRKFTKRYPDKGAVFFSLEMDRPQLVERLYTIETGHYHKDITDEEVSEIKEQHKNVTYITRASMSLLDIYSEVVKQRYVTDVKLVVIDFLTRIRTDVAGEYDFLRTATKFIKDMAKELRVSIIVLTQVGRETGKDGDVPLSMRSGRGSGTIEEDADYVLGAFRPELNSFIHPADRDLVKGIVCIQILGARRLPKMDDIFLRFDTDTLRLEELPRSWDGKSGFYQVVANLRKAYSYKRKQDEKKT